MRYAIYFLHAFPLSSKMWLEQIKYFGQKAKTIAIDYPGFGGTSDRSIPENPSLEHYAEFVEELIARTKEESEKIVLVGLSMGGYVVQCIIQRGKTSVDLVVLANTRSQADAPETRQKRLELIENAMRQNSIRPILDHYIPMLVGENEVMRERIFGMASEATVGGLTKALWAMAHRRDMTEVVRNFPKDRVLLIAGRKDKLSPPDVMRSMATDPDRQLKILDTGHLSAMEDPQGFNTVLEEFIFKKTHNAT